MQTVAYMVGDKMVLIDRDMLPYVQSKRWYISPRGYAHHKTKKLFEALHRTIVEATPEFMVDHINGNTLDNRRTNLRLCNALQNVANMRARHGCHSIYKGVFKSNSRKKPWRARLRHGDCTYNLGVFESEVDAAKAYDELALRLSGEFAKPNLNNSQIEIIVSEVYYQPDRKLATASKYFGVSKGGWKGRKWRARLFHKTQVLEEHYETEKDAALAWDKKSWELFKDPSRLNFPEEYLNDDSL